MFNQQDIDNLNAGIKSWEENNHKDLLAQLDALGVQHSKNSPNKIPLRRALKSALRKRFGLTNKISYSMPRSAVFLHKGVSRGHGKTNPRNAKEWFNPIVDKNIEELADIVADGQGNLVINNLDIR